MANLVGPMRTTYCTTCEELGGFQKLGSDGGSGFNIVNENMKGRNVTYEGQPSVNQTMVLSAIKEALLTKHSHAAVSVKLYYNKEIDKIEVRDIEVDSKHQCAMRVTTEEIPALLAKLQSRGISNFQIEDGKVFVDGKPLPVDFFSAGGAQKGQAIFNNNQERLEAAVLCTVVVVAFSAVFLSVAYR